MNKWMIWEYPYFWKHPYPTNYKWVEQNSRVDTIDPIDSHKKNQPFECRGPMNRSHYG